MKYLKELRIIDSDIYSNIGKASQKTIDLVEELIIQLDRDIEECPIMRDELGAINYDIDVLLEVWSHKLEYDIKILKRTNKIIENWYKDIEFVNKSLGIPIEEG